ncbi:MAG: YebC/PmpR family DNA-binding transcriptional regulator [Candidatus Jorgensenbacteria bacterium]
MAGHSHWKQIREHKGLADKKRGVLFAKLLRAITAAAKGEPNPQFNPRLRTTIEKAKGANVPQENIERAIMRASAAAEELEELSMEAYGPGGAALLIHAITDNKNRTIAEVKTVLRDHGGKWAEPGSVRWAFEEVGGEPLARFPLTASAETQQPLAALIETLEALDDVQRVSTNTNPAP